MTRKEQTLSPPQTPKPRASPPRAGSHAAQAVTTIGFDADDTLWQHEQFFAITQTRFQAALAEFADPDHLTERLEAAERRNLAHYGFGVKGFTLSMIETALEVTEGRVPGSVVSDILDAGRALHAHPIDLLPHAAETVETLARSHKLVLITKGDLFDQDRKLAQSGLGGAFAAVEVVSDKSQATYQRVFTFHGDGPQRALMVGNSMRSDVLPALAAGAWGVHVPHDLTWAVEVAPPPRQHPRFATLPTLEGLPDFVHELG